MVHIKVVLASPLFFPRCIKFSDSPTTDSICIVKCRLSGVGGKGRSYCFMGAESQLCKVNGWVYEWMVAMVAQKGETALNAIELHH